VTLARRHPWLLLVLATLFWSGNFVLGRAVSARVPPVGLAFWRWAVALAILLPLSWRELSGRWRLVARSWKVLLPLGVLGVGSFNTLVYLGLRETTATNALLLNAACPAFILAISAATGAGRATVRQAGGIALALLGVAAIVARGEPAALLALSPNRGDLWVLLAVLSWAVYTVLLPRRPEGLAPMGLLAVLVAVGVAFIAPLRAAEAAGGAPMTWDAATVASVLYVAGFASVAAYACWNQAVAVVGPGRAGLFLYLMPAFGSVLAALLLGESFRAFHAAGIGLILGGVWLSGGARPLPPRAPAPGTGRDPGAPR
jgi:drug/metabolite transporter (DMT)-like permease